MKTQKHHPASSQTARDRIERGQRRQNNRNLAASVEEMDVRKPGTTSGTIRGVVPRAIKR